MSSTALHNNSQDPFDPFALRVQTTSQPNLSLPLSMQSASNPPTTASTNTISPPPLFTRPPSISPTTLLSQFAIQPQPKPLSPYTRLSLQTSQSPKESPFSAFNPYFIPPISPSNHCKSPSLIQRNDDWTYCLSPSQRHESPRMGVKEANQVWEAQWSPFNGAARGSGTAAKAKSPSGGKFSWQWEENGHERDKGDDDSTSEEEDEEEQKEERKEHESTDDSAQSKKKTTSFAFESFEPAFPSAAPSSSIPLSAKYAIPTISPRSFKASLTPKQRRSSASSSATSSSAVAPVPTVTTFSLFPASSHPGSPPPPSPTQPVRSAAAVTPTDPVSSTNAPPAMATAAAAATVATTGPTAAALAAAALLKANTVHNKTIAATPEELFADLDTPAHGLSSRTRRQKAKSVCFCDEAPNAPGRVLAQVHMVPDDFTQYPIPTKKRKGKGKEKCRVM